MAIFSPLRPTTSPARPPATSKTHASKLRHSRISFCLVLSSASDAYTPCITSAQQLDFRSELAYTPHRRIKVFCTAMNEDWILSLSLNKHTRRPALILLLLSLQSPQHFPHQALLLNQKCPVRHPTVLTAPHQRPYTPFTLAASESGTRGFPCHLIQPTHTQNTCMAQSAHHCINLFDQNTRQPTTTTQASITSIPTMCFCRVCTTDG